MSNVTAVNETQ